jgi:hypothetical protein
MSTKTIPTTAAAPRTLGVPSFVVSTDMTAWPGADALRAYGTRVSHGVQLSVVDVPNPSRVRDAKQDRPPRGVPR